MSESSRIEPAAVRPASPDDPRVQASRQRPMAERLELAVSWNRIVAALRQRTLDVQLGDIVLPIAARADLIAMKRAAGRPQNLADTDFLEGLDDDPA